MKISGGFITFKDDLEYSKDVEHNIRIGSITNIIIDEEGSFEIPSPNYDLQLNNRNDQEQLVNIRNSLETRESALDEFDREELSEALSSETVASTPTRNLR